MRSVLALLLALTSTHAVADPPQIEAVEATRTGETWRFSVTLRHGDTGWDDYADGWRVLAPDGAVLGERPLAHPHVNEQPFTRSQSGIAIPDDLSEVYIEARDNVGGWSGERLPFPLLR